MARRSGKPPRTEAGETSRTRLLRATEARIIRHGAHSVTIRLIEAEAGVNSSLIGYYFGGLDGLLAELHQANLDLILDERTRLLEAATEAGREPPAEEILEAFLRSQWHEAAYSKGERALAVVVEVFGSAAEPLRGRAEERMRGGLRPIADALAKCLPDLDETTLLWRLCCLSGALVSILPRSAAWEMYEHIRGDPRAFTDEAWFQQMLDFAKGALFAQTSAAPGRASCAVAP